jgi:hypothetical protein
MTALSRAFGADLIQQIQDLLTRRGIFGHLPQILRRLFPIGTELPESVHQRLT